MSHRPDLSWTPLERPAMTGRGWPSQIMPEPHVMCIFPKFSFCPPLLHRLWTCVVALFSFLLWPFLLLPPAQSLDGSQVFFIVCCIWDSGQLCLPHTDAAEPGQRGHCLSRGCAQLLPCPLLWGGSTLAALWHSDPRTKPFKCNSFACFLGWSSLTSQISDLGDGGKTIMQKKLQKFWVLLLFSSAWILITSDCRMLCCQSAVQGCSAVLTRALFTWYCSGYISSNSIFKKYFEWEKFSAYDCMYLWYSWWHRRQIPSPVIAECTAGREKWGTLS